MTFDILLCAPPILAIYAVSKRNKALKKEEVGFVYDGKVWVTWLWTIIVFATLFLVFGTEFVLGAVALDFSNYRPEWDKLWFLLFSTVLYVSYVLIAYRPATAEELEAAKAAGQQPVQVAATAATSIFSTIVACILGVLASIPSLLWNALNPVLAVKVIGGMTYQIIGTGFSSVVGGIVGLGILVALVAMALIFGSLFIVIAGSLVIGGMAIYTFIKGMKQQ